MARQMKLSGVESMGDIPVTWSVVRVKDLCNENCKQLTTLPDEIRYVDIGSVSVNGIKSIQHLKKADIPSRARRLPQKGDIIVSNVRTYLRAITRVMEEGLVVSTGFSVFTPLTNTFPEFMFYTLQSDSFMDQVDASSKGISYPAISGSALRNLKIVQPSLNEQIAIASFLDDRTSAIDRKIQLLEEKATALADLRKSVIHQAVTKGLNPNAAMKPSGVDWIGDMPAHWTVTRGSDTFDVRQGYPFDSSKFADTGHSVIRMGDFDEQKCTRYYLDVTEVPSTCRVTSSTILMGLSGSIKTVVWRGEDAYLNQRIAALDFKTIEPGLACYLAELMAETIEVGLAATTIKNVSIWQLRKFLFPKAPPEEAFLITRYLFNKVSILDASINTITVQIDALKSLRQSLIHEAVTGKIDVADHGYHYA